MPPLSIVGERLRGLSPYRTPPHPAPTKLDANESPWGLPPAVKERLAAALAETPLHRYPDARSGALRQLLAARLDADPDELVLGVGSDEVISLLMAAFDRPRLDATSQDTTSQNAAAGGASASVVFPTPTFVMYPVAARIHGLAPEPVPLCPDWRLDRPAMLARIERARPNLIALPSPNNPTGNAFDDQDILAIVEASPDALVLIDEAYGPFSGRSLNGWVATHPNVAVMGTLSKIGLAGLRVGWVRLHRDLAAEVEKIRPPYNLNRLSERAAEVLLGEFSAVVDTQIEAICAERERLGDALRQLPTLRVAPSQANFFLVECEGSAELLYRALLEDGVQVRRFAAEPRLKSHLRITVGTPSENERLLAALSKHCAA